MAPKLDHTPRTNTVDLTGLPEPVVEQVQRIVEEARQQQAEPAQATNGDKKPTPTYVSYVKPSLQEARKILAEMAAMGKGNALPVDFSRADIYDDHD